MAKTHRIGSPKPAAQAPKPAAQAPKPAAQAPKGAQFVFSIGRPTGGGMLYAHTRAALDAVGVWEGGSVDKSTLVAIIGGTAVNHHLTSTGFFDPLPDGKVTLSAFGKENRHWIDAEATRVAAMRSAFATGDCSGIAGLPAGAKMKPNANANA